MTEPAVSPPSDAGAATGPTVLVQRSATTRSTSPEAPADGDRLPSYRPAEPSTSIGRDLRRVIGIDEDLLDDVPEERPRYTRMAAIVVAAGVMAMLSASVFLSRVGAPFVLLLPIALFWGLLILCFDSWLIASTHGSTGVGKLRIFIPRLLISVLMGAVVAEPLLLFLFGPSIQTEARDARLATISQYESSLKDCNPLDGSAPIVSGCGAEFILNVPGSPLPLRAERDSIEARRADLRAKVDGVTAELRRREELARSECNGTPTAHTTGVVGVGVNCRRNRTEADTFRTANDQTADLATLTGLGDSVDALNTEIGTAGAAYSAEVSKRIAAQVDAKRGNQSALGILDEHAALESLTERSSFVLWLSWLVRILLVVIDCLPVLTKLLSRNTTYDSMLRRQLDMSDRIHERRTTERENRDIGRLDVVIQREKQQVRTEMADIEVAHRATLADHERSVDDQIEELAAQLRGADDVLLSTP
jgi:hypothetical protein